MLIACDRPLQPVAALESTTSFYIYIYKNRRLRHAECKDYCEVLFKFQPTSIGLMDSWMGHGRSRLVTQIEGWYLWFDAESEDRDIQVAQHFRTIGVIWCHLTIAYSLCCVICQNCSMAMALLVGHEEREDGTRDELWGIRGEERDIWPVDRKKMTMTMTITITITMTMMMTMMTTTTVLVLLLVLLVVMVVAVAVVNFGIHHCCYRRQVFFYCSAPARWGSLDSDLNCECRISVGTAGPQPQAPHVSGHCRTFNCGCQIAVGAAGPARWVCFKTIAYHAILWDGGFFDHWQKIL